MNGRVVGVYLLASALFAGAAGWTVGVVHGSSRKPAVAWDSAGAARFLDGGMVADVAESAEGPWHPVYLMSYAGAVCDGSAVAGFSGRRAECHDGKR
jgi:hypothetical protein